MTRTAPALQFKLSDFIGDTPPIAQVEFIESPEPEVCWIGGFGCVAPETEINGVPIAEWQGGGVPTLKGSAWASWGIREGTADLYRVATQSGKSVVVTCDHQFLTPAGWGRLSTLRVGDAIAVGDTEHGEPEMGTRQGFRGRCLWGPRRGDEWSDPGAGGAQGRWRRSHTTADDGSAWSEHDLLSIVSSVTPVLHAVAGRLRDEQAACESPRPVLMTECGHRPRSLAVSFPPDTGGRFSELGSGTRVDDFVSSAPSAGPSDGMGRRIYPYFDRITRVTFVKCGEYFDLTVPGVHHYFAQGIWHHNCGKTVGLSAKMILTMLRYPGSRLMLCRRTYDELMKTTKQTFFRVGEPLKKAGLIERPLRGWDYKEQTNYVRLTTGAELHFSNLEDISKFKNIEVTGVGIDQAEENELEIFQMLKRRMRPTFRQKEVPPAARQMLLIANDEGRNWLWDRYHPNSVGTVPQRRFIHSTSLENPHLDEEYIKNLLSMPPEWVNKYVYARMDSHTGRLLPDPVVISHCFPPPEVDIYLGVDHGETTVCAAHWGFENTLDHTIPPGIPPGYVCVFREYWREGATVEEHARNILAMSQQLKVVSRVMDHTTFNLTQTRRGGIRSNIADLYRECGLTLTPSMGNPDTRVERINVVHGRGMMVTKDCPNYIRQAPHYHTKVNRRTGLPEIVNKSTYHAVDSMGYLVMSMPHLGPRGILREDDEDLPPHLRPDSEYWRQARDEPARQFAVGNYRERSKDPEETEPFGAEFDDFWSHSTV